MFTRIIELFSDRTIKKANRVLGVLLVIYVYSMLIHPWILGRFQWDYVHAVWYTWQSLNVGVLAFTSSVVAFNISKFREEKRLEREFIAERALLPQALDDLSTYLSESVPVIAEGYYRCSLPHHERKSPLESPLPIPDKYYILVFQNCIRVAENHVGNHLAQILSELQVHDARLIHMYQSFSENSSTLQIRMNFISYLFCLAKLQAYINRLFDFARGESSFDTSILGLEDFRSAYRSLDIFVETYEGLDTYTANWVESQSNT